MSQIKTVSKETKIQLPPPLQIKPKTKKTTSSNFSGEEIFREKTKKAFCHSSILISDFFIKLILQKKKIHRTKNPYKISNNFSINT